ncbi:MAG TPA: hypothetical protein VFT68_17200 [Lapillicoccus sp.]|nr:hypothetical protein [Lapillicoccus sp.]
MVAPPRPDLDALDRFVVVDGAGSLVLLVARLLRAEGVRSVEAGVWAADSADAELRRTGTGAPDLVILVRAGVVDPRLGEPWRRRGVPHLPVTTSRTRVVAGPWLTGDPDEPCLGCVASRPATLGAASDALVTAGAGMAAMVALAGLTGQALPSGVSVEVHAPWPRVDHRRWSRDPDCPLHGDVSRPAGRQAATSVF